jgi:hypothetical protein
MTTPISCRQYGRGGVLRFQHSNLCLLVKDQGTANATPIVQGTYPGSSDFSKGFDLVE